MRRTLYWKRLLIVVAAFLALTSGVYAIHHFQLKTQSSALKDQVDRIATQAETDPAKRAEALEHLKKYLRFRPDDEASYQKYAALWFTEVKADPAALERAAGGIEAFLREFPKHAEERQKLVELYVATGQVTKLALAKKHIEVLMEQGGGAQKNIEVLELAATCEFGLGNLQGAIGHVEAAVATEKAPVRTYVRAMELHHVNKGDPKRNTNIDDHLRALRTGRFASNLEARVAAARFEMVLKNWSTAAADMKDAFDRLGGGENPDALLAMAELALAGIKATDTEAQIKEQHAKAEGHLRKAFALDKKNVQVGMLLAEVLARLGKRDDGVQVLKQTADALGEVNDQYLMLVDRLIDLGEQELSASLTEKLGTDAHRKVIVSYYRGRLAVLKQEWPTGLRLLEESAPNLVRVPLYHKKAMVGLAACYAAMQNPEKQLEYCRMALRDDGGYPVAVIGEAEALVKMGELEEALKRYRIIVHAMQIVGYRPELARLELHDLLGQPAQVRNWTRFEESLGPPASRTPEVHVMHAESLVARGQAADAVKLLEGWLSANPADPKAASVWVAISRIKDGAKPGDGAAVLDEAQKKVGNAVEIRLARAALLVSRARPPAPEEFDALAAEREKLPKPDQFRLLIGIGVAAGRVADRGGDKPEGKAMRETAIKHLRAAADVMPKDLVSRAALLDQGVAAGRRDVVDQALKEMAAVEGENGPVGALGRIAIRLPDVRKLTGPARAAGVRELRALAATVQKQRPGWGRAFVALGQLDELDGLNDAALVNYRAAIKKGERQEFVIRSAVNLYRVKRQDEAAVGLLTQLSTEMRLPDDLERYRSIHKLADDLPQHAKPTIDRIAPAESTDYRIQLLRGSLLAAIRDDDNALKAFLRAVEVPGGEKVPGEGPIPAGEDVPETWAALVAQLVKTGKPADAKRAVDEAERKLTRKEKEPKTEQGKADLQVALGGLHELISDLKAALTHYEAARKTAPRELNPVRQLVVFFQRTGQPDKAFELLNAVKDAEVPDIARWARRHLALTLLTRLDAYKQRTVALELIDRNLAVAANDPEDVKAKATIQTVDPVTREEGTRTLRQFGDRGDLTPDEFYLLGRLAFDQGKFLEGEKYFKLGARVRPGVTAEHMAGLVRVYVALNTLGDADLALERLKANFPTSWEAVREEARLLYRKSKNKAAVADFDDAKRLLEQARAVIVKYPNWDAVGNLYAKSGPLFDELGLKDDAETAYKKFLAESPLPAAHVPLTVFYVTHKQPEKAIALAREREAKVSPAVTAQLLSGAVRMKRPGAAVEAEIEKWLADKLREAAGNPEAEAPLIGARAELLDAQGKYDDAIKEYERGAATFARAVNPKSTNDRAVNNLCMLLALHDKKRAGDAVKMMTDLIAIRGPVPAFLDTRAVAHIVTSNPTEAVKDLDLALKQADRAVYHYHLALALDLEGSKSRPITADKELQAAKALNLTADDLHPLEYERYVLLLKKHLIPVPEK